MTIYFLITTNGTLTAKFADETGHAHVFAMVADGLPIKGRFNLPGSPSVAEYEAVIDPKHLVAVLKAQPR